MNLMSAVVTAPAIALPLPAKARGSDRDRWDLTVTRFKTLTARVQEKSKANWALHDAAEKACPRRGDFFSRYGMGHGCSYDRNFQAAHTSIVIERTRAKGGHLTSDEARQATADAQLVVAEFESYSARYDAAFAEYDRAEEQFDKLVDEQAQARDAMFETPAPDNAALLYKIEVLADRLSECEDEDAETVAAILSDARRLLSVGRA